MQKWLLTAETNCSDPSRESEFNEWYDNVHVPDILETPGVLRATRYENNSPAEGRGKFLALYEIETDDIGQTMVALQENISAKAKQGRMTELVAIVSMGTYKQIAAPVESR